MPQYNFKLVKRHFISVPADATKPSIKFVFTPSKKIVQFFPDEISGSGYWQMGIEVVYKGKLYFIGRFFFAMYETYIQEDTYDASVVKSGPDLAEFLEENASDQKA